MLKLYLKLGIPVLVTCIIASAGLAVTYAVTKDRIAEQNRLAKERSLKIVLPNAKPPFEEVTDGAILDKAAKAAGDTRVDGVFRAVDVSGAQIGWGLLVAPRGYGGPISMAVGVDGDGKVTGVTIVAMNETPGLGTKVITEKGFLPSFEGLDANQGQEAVRKVDTIQGATKSSRGVKHGVEAAANIYAQVLANVLGGGQ